jgi:hypothetical protein
MPILVKMEMLKNDKIRNKLIPKKLKGNINLYSMIPNILPK